MKLSQTRCCVVLAVIMLVASGAIANSGLGLARQSSGTVVEFGVAADGARRPVSGPDQVASQTLAAGQSSHRDGCELDCCAQSAGSGCCPAGMPLTSGSRNLDRALITACSIVERAFLATGIDPEALLHPPKIFG